MVRQAKLQDLQQIAAVHCACFPDSFSTTLGEKLLARFYRGYMEDVPELFLVAEAENRIIGFCMGYYCENNPYMKRFLKHNLVRVGLRMAGLLLIGNKAAWKKVRRVFAKKNISQTVNTQHQKIQRKDCGDLLSICVLTEYRGSGSAQALISLYEQVLQERGRKACLLTVAVDNPRAIHFYERNGYMPYKEAAGIARSYLKRLH